MEQDFVAEMLERDAENWQRNNPFCFFPISPRRLQRVCPHERQRFFGSKWICSECGKEVA